MITEKQNHKFLVVSAIPLRKQLQCETFYCCRFYGACLVCDV